MTRIWLKYRAPFAAFRMFQAGDYRSTWPTIPPSAAWGLVLNLAGIDIRGEERGGITTIRPDAPPLRLSLGSFADPELAVLLQQLHVYPVGNSGEELAERTHGAKYWIKPIRREFLVDCAGAIGIETEDADLGKAIAAGLRGDGASRYGLPFAGDNQLLFDRLEIADAPGRARWWVQADEPLPGRPAFRLTVAIDRVDSQKTRGGMFTLEQEERDLPPDLAWCWTPRAPEVVA